ncbi:cytochrome P450 4C1 [Anabrus simplex]|uniref:cytochrome P450 4C1 n=1 Tax=Anabrus simplex TaxID=316456 RepID=UPI0035A3BF98
MDLVALLITLVLMAYPAVLLMNWARRRSRFSMLIDKIPGPWALPLVGTAFHLFTQPRDEIFKFVDGMSRSYLPIFRTWAGPTAEVHLAHPKHIEVIMNSSVHIEKSSFYDFLHPWLGEGLLTSTGRKWHSHRKLITPTFHFKILESFTEVFAEKSHILVQKLKKEVNGKGFNIYPYITHCALDIICETAMGTTINAQDGGESEYVSAVYETSEVSLNRAVRPWLYPDFIFYRSSVGKKFKKNLNILHGFTNKIIQERKMAFSKKSPETNAPVNDGIGIKKRMAFLDLLLEASDDGKLLSDVDIREEVDTFMFEGHDTTSAGICYALLLLGHHPDVQEKVFQELNEIFQGSDRHPTMKDLQEMKYLERVIKETLRLYPSVPFIGRTLQEDVKIGDYTVPAGCTLWIHIYHTHRLPEYYPNPDQFDPDNFLPDRTMGRHPYAYVPFSAGPRNCVGQKFAMFEEKTILSSILRNYKVKSLDKIDDIKLLMELVLRPAHGINVTLEAR